MLLAMAQITEAPGRGGPWPERPPDSPPPCLHSGAEGRGPEEAAAAPGILQISAQHPQPLGRLHPCGWGAPGAGTKSRGGINPCGAPGAPIPPTSHCPRSPPTAKNPGVQPTLPPPLTAYLPQANNGGHTSDYSSSLPSTPSVSHRELRGEATVSATATLGTPSSLHRGAKRRTSLFAVSGTQCGVGTGHGHWEGGAGVSSRAGCLVGLVHGYHALTTPFSHRLGAEPPGQ